METMQPRKAEREEVGGKLSYWRNNYEDNILDKQAQ